MTSRCLCSRCALNVAHKTKHTTPLPACSRSYTVFNVQLVEVEEELRDQTLN